MTSLPSCLRIAPTSPGQQERPRVAFGGGVFLVAWQDFNGNDCDAPAARVSADGRVLNERPIAVAVGPRTQALPDVASDGRNFLVVWQGLVGEETSYRGFATLVAAGGRIAETVDTGATPPAKVAWNGKNYLVVCEVPGSGPARSAASCWIPTVARPASPLPCSAGPRPPASQSRPCRKRAGWS